MELEELNKLKKETLDGGILYKPKEPAAATVLSCLNVAPEGEDDWIHIVLDLSGKDYKYVEGLSLGIVPPGEREPGKPHRVRLYSIVSARMGDDGTGNTASISVKRLVYKDPETGEQVKGVASNYICDLKVGDTVQVTGPVGKTFVLPEPKDADLLLFASGTGIAPFVSFLNHLLVERKDYTGEIVLFYGVRTSKDLAYMNDISNILGEHGLQERVHIHQALSREKPELGKVYVQHRLLEQKEKVWEIMQRGNFGIYLCGIKGMEKGIDESFQTISQEQGVDWEEYKGRLKKEGRWNQEVY